MCAYGNVRSAALARSIRDYYPDGNDAIAIGWVNQADDTKQMLVGWADLVVVTDATYTEAVEAMAGEGTDVWTSDVGEDVWGSPTHPALQEMMLTTAHEMKARGQLS